jgi:hypothetical protein
MAGPKWRKSRKNCHAMRKRRRYLSRISVAGCSRADIESGPRGGFILRDGHLRRVS